MKTRIVNLYQKLSASYWFIPSAMAILAVSASGLLVYLDRYNQQGKLIDLTWISLTGAAGARAIPLPGLTAVRAPPVAEFHA
jgi:uncharacterized membrane protein